MAAVSGNGGVLQVTDTGTTAYTAIASLQSWSLERSSEAIETSAMGTSTAKTFVPGQTSFSGSAEALWNDDQTDGQEAIEEALKNGDSNFKIKLYPIGTSSGDFWSGDVIVTGVSFSSSLNSPVGFSFTFQGTGVLVHNDA